MTRALLLAALAIALGIGTAEYLAGNFTFRRWLGEVVRRGELQALVARRGIYDTDVERAWQAEVFAEGGDPGEIDSAVAEKQKRLELQPLVAQARVTAAARHQSLPSAEITREMDLLRAQYPDAKTWERARARAAVWDWELQHEVRDHLRDRAWIEHQIAEQIRPNESECRRYFAEHAAEFQEPVRLRASHLFLAAPDGSPEDVIESKRALAGVLAKRLANGEAFPALVAEFSEDEATKKRGGDLGYFAQSRMLPPVWEAARKLQPGEISRPVQSRLGFHLLRLTTALPARALSFEQAQPEIVALLENEKRSTAVAALSDR